MELSERFTLSVVSLPVLNHAVMIIDVTVLVTVHEFGHRMLAKL